MCKGVQKSTQARAALEQVLTTDPLVRDVRAVCALSERKVQSWAEHRLLKQICHRHGAALAHKKNLASPLSLQRALRSLVKFVRRIAEPPHARVVDCHRNAIVASEARKCVANVLLETAGHGFGRLIGDEANRNLANCLAWDDGETSWTKFAPRTVCTVHRFVTGW